jgi:hypothetical protein
MWSYVYDFHHHYKNSVCFGWEVDARRLLSRFVEYARLNMVFDIHEGATEVEFHPLPRMTSAGNGNE